MIPDNLSLVISTSRKEQIEKAHALADELCLPLYTAEDLSYAYQLVYTDFRLQLQQNPNITRRPTLPVYAEFLHNSLIHRRIISMKIQDPLAKAAGVKKGVRPQIVDGTAGLGIDGVSLAWIGCKVTLIERSPIIHALLLDGLQRAERHPLFAKKISGNLTLLSDNSEKFLTLGTYRPDTVIFDPMYPQKKKGPKSKKEMSLLRAIVGNDTDASEVFLTAISAAKSRVAVKRPKGAAVISDHFLPSYSVAMKSGRFDVYIKDHL